MRKIRFSPDGTLLASASDDKSVIIWDVGVADGMLRRVHDKFDVNTVDWFPDGRRVVFGTDKQVGIIDVADENAEIRRIDIGGVAEVRVFADGLASRRAAPPGRGSSSSTRRWKSSGPSISAMSPGFASPSDESQMFAASWEGETAHAALGHGFWRGHRPRRP